MQKLRIPPRHSILLKANHNMFSKVRSMHTYYRCGKVTDTRLTGCVLRKSLWNGGEFFERRGCVEGVNHFPHLAETANAPVSALSEYNQIMVSTFRILYWGVPFGFAKRYTPK